MVAFQDITLNLPAIGLAAFGLGVTVYAAMETEPEDIRRRAMFGVTGLVLLIAGVAVM